MNELAARRCAVPQGGELEGRSSCQDTNKKTQSVKAAGARGAHFWTPRVAHSLRERSVSISPASRDAFWMKSQNEAPCWGGCGFGTMQIQQFVPGLGTIIVRSSFPGDRLPTNGKRPACGRAFFDSSVVAGAAKVESSS